MNEEQLRPKKERDEMDLLKAIKQHLGMSPEEEILNVEVTIATKRKVSILAPKIDRDPTIMKNSPEASTGKKRGRPAKVKTTDETEKAPGKPPETIPWFNKKVEKLRQLLFEEKLNGFQEAAVSTFLALDPSLWTITKQKQMISIYNDVKDIK